MKPLSYLILLLILFSCNPKKEKDKISDFAKSNAEVSELAMKYGDIISMETKKKLGMNLMKAVQEGGVIHALDFCNLNAYPLVDSLEKKYHANIRRATVKTRNPEDAPDEVENEIIQQYDELLARGESANPMIKELDNDIWLYTKPIILDNALCLNCHGTPGNEIGNENYEHIKKLYPDDKAINYTVGELRGIWSISFNKQQLLNGIGSE